MPNLKYPYCLKPRGMNAFSTSIFPMTNQRTDTGVERRQLLSEIPYGAFVELEYSWSDRGVVKELFDFWAKTSGDHKNFTIPYNHTLWNFLPIKDQFIGWLPSELWRFDTGLSQVQFSPKRSGSSDFKIKLLNVIGEPASVI
jgi:hypothetical protein